ncbi:MAG: DMT family transporter [Saprospiraceae bacterium]|nr:DMT family transporter [Saprospiraceae bacterium]
MIKIHRSFVFLHLAVFLFGFTGILGELIQLSAIWLVWWRALLTCLILIPVLFWEKSSWPTPKNLFRLMGVGAIVGLHWICFYGSIKLSNSSVAMICLATIPFFTSLFESMIYRRSMNKTDILFSLLILPGIILIAGGLSFDYQIGLWVGIVAAMLSGLFATLNKKYISTAGPLQITFLELFSVWLMSGSVLIILDYFQPSNKFIPNTTDSFYLILLSLFCTVVAFALTVASLRHLSAFTAMLAFNLEPVYGIILSYFLINNNKDMSLRFYSGVAIILLVVFTYPFAKNRRRIPAI